MWSFYKGTTQANLFRTGLGDGVGIKALVPSVCGEGKKKTKQKTAGARSSKMLVLEVTRWEMTENSFHSSNSKRSVQPLFQCLKTSRCCSRLAFPYLCSDNIWKPAFLFSSTFFLWRNIQSYRMQASPPTPPFSHIGNVEWILSVAIEEKNGHTASCEPLWNFFQLSFSRKINHVLWFLSFGS